jgi:predicted dehydrogenase
VSAQPLTESRPHAPRLGLLGLGWIGRRRLEALVSSAAAEVVALADPVPGAAERAADLAPGARLVASLDELLAADLDGVVIATPSALHAAQSIAALRRGVAVFCQKPLGRDAAETAAVVDAARAADRLLGVDLSYRLTDAMQKVSACVRSGQLGRIYAAELTFHNAYGPDKPWFYDRSLSGGGCVIDLGIHLVDLLLWTLDFPEVAAVSARVFAKGRLIGPQDEVVEDYADARLELASGAVARIACSWRLHAGRDAVIEAAFHGTEGGAALRNVGGSFVDFVAERYRGTGCDVLSRPPDAWGGRTVVEWARRLAQDARFDPGAERLVDVAQVLDAMYGRKPGLCARR